MSAENGQAVTADPKIEAVNSPAPAEKPAPSSLENPSDDFNKRVGGAKTLADYQVLKAEAMKPRPKVEAPAAPTPAEETTPAEPAAEVTTEEPAAPEPEAKADPDEDEDEGDSPIQPTTSKRPRVQLPADDKLGRLAVTLLQRNRDWTLEQATEAARNQLGIKPKSAEATPEAPKSDLPPTIGEVDTTLDGLDVEREKALTELRFEDVAKIDRNIRKLDRHRITLEREADQRRAEEVATYDRLFSSSESRASELYEFASDAESDGGKRMREIEADLKANDDPLYSDPNKPLKLAQMVARELNIAPKRKGAPAAPAKAAAPATPAPAQKKQVLPAGGSRTVAPPVNQQPADVARVQGIKNLADLNTFRKSLGLSR